MPLNCRINIPTKRSDRPAESGRVNTRAQRGAEAPNSRILSPIKTSASSAIGHRARVTSVLCTSSRGGRFDRQVDVKF